MNRTLPVNSFESSRHIGAVCEIGPSSARVALSAADSNSAEVGAFVTIELEEWVLFERLTSIQSNRQSQNEAVSSDAAATTAVAEIELLATAAADGKSAIRGIARSPHLGSAVYLATPQLLRWLFQSGQLREIGEDGSDPIMLELMSLADGVQVGVAPERLFGRHCAVVGATGTGKSWTLARLIEESVRH